jgi:NADH-quinone oxidoreductase subunit H
MTPGAIIIRALIVGFIISLAVITGFAYTTLLERKVLARLQARIGPNRAGYIPIPIPGRGEKRFLGGFMQPAADAVKLFFKEDPTPSRVDRVIYNLAPMLAVIPAILILAVIPWAPAFKLFNWEFTPYFAIAPGINVGVLFILAITSIGVYGVVLAGWASNSKYAVLGGIRASAQMISYELALSFIVLIPRSSMGSARCGTPSCSRWPRWCSSSPRWPNCSAPRLTCWRRSKNCRRATTSSMAACASACSSWRST